MNCIDLFAGAGGLSEGFRRVNYNIIAHVEKDYAASLTLKTREAFWYLKENNKLDIYKSYMKGDISRSELYNSIPKNILNKVINEEISDTSFLSICSKIDDLLEDKKVHIIIGGPPCQAYSIAGRSRDPHKMENDPRNYLYKQYLKFIKYYTPKIFVFENVEGLLSAKNGMIFEVIKSDMKSLGYNIDYKLLDSKKFGVLQSRKRIILIGWKKDIKFEYPIFDNIDNKYTINDLFSDLPKIKAGDKVNYISHNIKANNCLRDLHIRDNCTSYLTQHVARPNRDIDLKIYKLCVKSWNEENKQLKYNELPEDLITHNNTKVFLDRFKVVKSEGVSHTIVSHIAKDGHYYIHPDINQNRSISVREAARIQSFPDDYYFEDSRTAAFTQIGNAVPPLMAEIIAQNIKDQF